MVIKKQPIISWLLDLDDRENVNRIYIPILQNTYHSKYLSDGMNFLADIRNDKPDWGLPELIMPSFEEVMAKSAKSFLNIDHELFQEFYKQDVCGILISKDCGTIVYGFGEDTLYVWIFRQDEENNSTLYLYFYIKSRPDNQREIFTWPTLLDDQQLFTGNREDLHKIYQTIANKLMIYLAVKKYVKVETIVVPNNQIIKFNPIINEYKTKEKIKNDSGQKVVVLDSRWFRKIVNDNNIFVRGFLRLQNKKNERGEWYKELIFVDSYIRNGYHRNAEIEKED